MTMNRVKIKKAQLMIQKTIRTSQMRLQKQLNSDFLTLLDYSSVGIAKSNEIKFSFNFKLLKEKLNKTFKNNFKRFLTQKKIINFELWDKEEEDFPIEHIERKLTKGYMAKLVSKIADIADTAEKTLKKVVANGIKQGLGYKEFGELIQTNIAGMSTSKARVIALTESQTINSVIDNDMAKEVKMKKKIWIHNGGTKTDRPSHAVLDMVSIGIEEYFDVGGVPALYPQDSSLGPEDVINCHCLCIYE